MNSILYSPPFKGLLKVEEIDGKITGISYQKSGTTNLKTSSSVLRKTIKELDEYFSGKRKKFTVPLLLDGTEFQKKVWKSLQKIPYGKTASYKDVAIDIKNDKSYRAVGMANNKNKIIILVPCHRVIKNNGDSKGFAIEQNIKEFLLNLEKK